MQFKTTKTFLRSFGLTSLEDLPELPSATQEEAQLTMQLESALQRLQQAETEEPEEEPQEEEGGAP
jgi:segregation and condensation protein B